MKKMLFVLILISVQSVIASDLADELAKLMRPRMVSLDRDMTVFRYETKKTFEPTSQRDIKAHLNTWSERFYNPAITSSDAQGPGTYVAIDPYASRSYGMAAPQLYVLIMRRNSKILDLAAEISSEERSVMNQFHQEAQCKKKQGLEEFLIPESDLSLNSMRQSTTEACRSFIIDVLKKLNAQAIMYNFSASNSLVDCRFRFVAFNVISSAALDFDRSSFYSNENIYDSNLPGAVSAANIKKLYDESSQDVILQLQQYSVGTDSMPAKLLSSADAEQSRFSDWKKKAIMNCGDLRSIEKEESGYMLKALDKNFKANFADAEIQSLILKLKVLYPTKAPSYSSFFLLSVRKIARLIYLGSGLPDDEKLFKDWLSLIYGHSSDPGKTTFLKLYGLDSSAADVMTKGALQALEYVKKMSDSEVVDPEFLRNLYGKFGVTGGYVDYSISELNVYKGGVPILSHDPKKTYLENIEVSKKMYKEALSACIKLYEDPAITSEEIKQADCVVDFGY